MSSFFAVPGAKKRKRDASSSAAPKKRPSADKANGSSTAKSSTSKRQTEGDDESISGLESEDDLSMGEADDAEEASENSASDSEEETAAERRLRLAERYLDNVKEHVDEVGFDAADIDRDLIAERLQEDVAESKGRVYRQLAPELALSQATQTFFRTNTRAVTSVSACAPYFYTTTKDIFLHKWKTQDLPKDQFPRTTRRRPKKASAPPKKKPELESWIKGNSGKSKEKYYKRHTGRILCVAASPDGKYVVTGGEDKKIIAYEASTLKPIKVMTHHRDAVTGLAFRRGTNQLYSCSKDRTVKVWSLDEMAYVETLFGHQDEILDIDALAQERCISVGARDRTARLWKVIEETQLVFRGGSDKKTRVEGVDQRSLLKEGSMDRIAMIDDDLFVTGSDNGSIALWSAQKKKPVYIEALAHGIDPALDPHNASAEQNPTADAVPAPAPRWITALKTIPYSDIILSGSWDGHVRVWRLSEDKRKIEPVGVLGGHLDGEKNEMDQTHERESSTRAIPGVINDIAVFERGDRGRDGICVVAAVSREHRFGRWQVSKEARNGGVVFEIPRDKSLSNGDEEEEGTEYDD